MLVISAGIPKSGSALIFNIINEILIKNNFSDIRKIRAEYKLDDVILADDCYIHSLDETIMKRLAAPLSNGHSFVIKTHNFPADGFFRYIDEKLSNQDIKYIFSIRDPRDVLLSAMEHYKKDNNSFVEFHNFENSVISTYNFLFQYTKWLNFSESNIYRYEDFHINLTDLSQSLIDALGLDQSLDYSDVLNKFHKNALQEKDSSALANNLHFNKGKTGRYKQNFSPEQIYLMDLVFSDFELFSYYKSTSDANENSPVHTEQLNVDLRNMLVYLIDSLSEIKKQYHKDKNDFEKMDILRGKFSAFQNEALSLRKSVGKLQGDLKIMEMNWANARKKIGNLREKMGITRKGLYQLKDSISSQSKVDEQLLDAIQDLADKCVE